MEKLYIDFETASTVDIALGLDKYFKGTHIICLYYAIGDEEPKQWLPEQEIPQELIQHINNGGRISGYNVIFEYYCLRLMGLEPTITQLRDTKAQTNMCNVGSSLGASAVNLGLPQDKQKDKRGKELIKLLSVPRKDGTFNKDPALLQEMYDYCKQDVIVERAISVMLPELPEHEQKAWEVTQEINLRGMPIDVELVEKCQLKIEENAKTLEARAKELLGFNVTQVSLLKGFLGTEDCTAKTMQDLLDDPNTPRIKRKAVELRQELGATGAKKYKTILGFLCDDNTVKHSLIYHGAGTGRFSSVGLQMQNLARPPLHDDQEEMIEALKTKSVDDVISEYGSLVKVAVSCIRGAFYTPQGFLDSDFSQIEMKTAFYIADEWDTLNKYRGDFDLYKDFATKLYGVTVDKVSKDQRQISKSAALSCVYGSSAKGLQGYAEGMGITMDLKQAEVAVNGYRKAYPKVVNIWKELHGLAMMTVAYSKEHSNGMFTFRVEDDFLTIELPSKRKLYYFKPQIRKVQTPFGASTTALTVMKVNTFTRKFERSALYPALVFQNVNQALARDFLVDAMLRMDAMGVRIVSVVHDEVLAHKDDFDFDTFNEVMETLPAWVDKRFPLEADGYEGTRYRK